jgi:hypothetical protein
MTKLHTVKEHVRRSPAPPQAYLAKHEALWNEVVGGILCLELEGELFFAFFPSEAAGSTPSSTVKKGPNGLASLPAAEEVG